MDIPKIFHNVWLDKKDKGSKHFPKKYKSYVNKKEELHPEFTHMLWSYNETLELMNNDEFLAQYIDFFDNVIEKWICKCDFARLAIVYIYGGVYADLDINFVKNISPLIEEKSQYFVYEPIEHINSYGNILIWNGFFACTQRHPFIKFLMEYIYENYNQTFTSWIDVIEKTGPRAVARAYEKYPDKFYVDSECAIIPYGFSHTYSKNCKPGEEYAKTEWNEGTNWSNEIYQSKHEIKPMPWKNIAILIVVVIVLILLVYFLRYN
jgi:mannosyltransferase OCH1-like enzyme